MRDDAMGGAWLLTQHQTWQHAAMDAWERAGISAGSCVLDLGCGPGFATVELARLVGPDGRVIAVDRAGEYLEHLAEQAREQKLSNIEIVQGNIDEIGIDADSVDFVWMRWVTAFVADPRRLMVRVARALRRGGRLISHEYGETPELGDWVEEAGLGISSRRQVGGIAEIIAGRGV